MKGRQQKARFQIRYKRYKMVIFFPQQNTSKLARFAEKERRCASMAVPYKSWITVIVSRVRIEGNWFQVPAQESVSISHL